MSLIGNKKLGISSSMRHLCAICIPKDIPFFKYDWKKEIWNLFFVVGIFLGGFIATQFLSDPNEIQLAQNTKDTLIQFGISDFSQLMPTQIFSVENIFTLRGFFFFVLGGFCVGFALVGQFVGDILIGNWYYYTHVDDNIFYFIK